MNVFEQLGCKEDSEYKGLYTHPRLPFSMNDDKGLLALRVNLEYRIDKGKIPLTKENLINLINSFDPNGGQW